MSRHLYKALIAAVVLAAGLSLSAAQITVFAGASLTDSLKEIGAAYGKMTGEEVVFNFAASYQLAEQIEAGAPADILFSADDSKMNELDKKNLIVSRSRKDLLSNTLVIVVPRESPGTVNSVNDLTNAAVRRIAMADPTSDPSGNYAIEYLKKKSIWSLVQPKVLQTQDVRAALAAVEAGKAEAGIVFKTDASVSQKVKVAYSIPADESPNIKYAVAIVKESQEQRAAKKFMQYLTTQDAANIFRKFGFAVLK